VHEQDPVWDQNLFLESGSFLLPKITVKSRLQYFIKYGRCKGLEQHFQKGFTIM
jgi:hypothetical protein